MDAIFINFTEECGGALGMESGAIKDEQINASSSHSAVSVGPHIARWVIPSYV